MSLRYPDACIALFARAPVPGQVKTRLIPALGAEGACRLHEQLLQRIITVLNGNPLCHAELWTDQQPEHPAFASFAGSVLVQQGPDLGARLNHAAMSLLRRYRQVLFIGTDCPGLDQAYLARALEVLQTCDVVIGPALDGGYVLLGIKQWHPTLFTGIEWGSAEVLQRTLAAAAQAALHVELLNVLADIDRPEDLPLLANDCCQ